MKGIGSHIAVSINTQRQTCSAEIKENNGRFKNFNLKLNNYMFQRILTKSYVCH